MTGEIKIQTFKPGEPLPKNLILPQQSHSPNIVKIETGLEDLANTDGIRTTNKNLLIGVKTADCAPICIWKQNQFGVLHAGWRGTVNGAVENLLSVFETGLQNRDRSPNFKIYIGPILPRFEIQRDDCYQQIYDKFGDQFFTNEDQKLFFEFKACLQHLLPGVQFDARSTFEDKTLSSWRRDKHFENGQNVTVIGPANLF